MTESGDESENVLYFVQTVWE